jgi:hypothetical protein
MRITRNILGIEDITAIPIFILIVARAPHQPPRHSSKINYARPALLALDELVHHAVAVLGMHEHHFSRFDQARAIGFHLCRRRL